MVMLTSTPCEAATLLKRLTSRDCSVFACTDRDASTDSVMHKMALVLRIVTYVIPFFVHRHRLFEDC